MTRAGVNMVKRRIQFLHHIAKRRGKRRPPSDQHVIVTVAQTSRGGQSHKLAQAPPDPVALHGIADLPRDREAHPHAACIGIGAPARL